MAKFIFKFDGELFRVRLLQSGEKFTHPIQWEEDVQFEMTESSMFMVAWTSLLPDLTPEEANALARIAAARYPVSPDYQKLKSLCPEIIVGDKTDEWVFFGGSFHPWHQGHQACLNLLPEEKSCFVLPDRNPLKEVREVHLVSTIIALASKIKFKKNQFLVPTFLLEEKPNPTAQWLRRIRKDHPEKKLSLLLGFDSLRTIDQWIDYRDVLTHLDCIYVVSRLENDEERESVMEALVKLAPGLMIQHLGHHDFEGLSSTEIRKRR